MDMIRRVACRIGLHIDELDKERRPLDSVIMTNPWLIRPSPREVDLVEPSLVNQLPSIGSHFLAHRSGVNFQ
jgi:hypothetical protein